MELEVLKIKENYSLMVLRTEEWTRVQTATRNHSSKSEKRVK